MDPIEKLRTSHPAFHAMNPENITMYFGVGVPHIYLAEAAVTGVTDLHPMRKHMAGELGALILKHFLTTMEDGDKYLMICDDITDRCYITRDPAIHQVVILDIVMDSSAFRLPEMADCRVFELQVHQVVRDEKERLVEASGATMYAKERHDLTANFRVDGWQHVLLSNGFNPEEPTLWVVGSILSYMTVAGGSHLMSVIESLSAPRSQIYADMFVGHTAELHDTKDITQTVTLKNPAFFEGHGDHAHAFQTLSRWCVELLARRDEDLNYYGSMWDQDKYEKFTVKDHQTGCLGPWFIVRFSKPDLGGS